MKQRQKYGRIQPEGAEKNMRKQKRKAGKTPDYSTPEGKKRFVKKIWIEKIQIAESIDVSIESFLEGPYGRRRQMAVLNCLDRAEKDFQPLGLESVMETFAYEELQPFITYNLPDVRGDLRMGAVLWILEKLKAAGRLREARALLPDPADSIRPALLLTGFYHPCFDEFLIQTVFDVVNNRYGEGHGAPLNEVNAVGEMPDETYRSLLRLISYEEIEKACTSFRDRLWEIETIRMKGNGYYAREIGKISQEIRNHERDPLSAPFARPKSAVTIPQWQGGSPVDPMDMAKSEDLAARAKECLEQKKDFQRQFDEYFWMDRKTLRRRTGSRELTEAMQSFSVSDPYELCFALFYLLDSGDDMVWLMGAGTSLMRYVQRQLPWYQDTSGWEDEDLDAWFTDIPYDRNGWMERKNSTEEPIDFFRERHGGRNLAQIVYSLCRTVVPTGLHPFEEDRKQLTEEGMDEALARRITDLAEILFLQKFQASWYMEQDEDEDWNGDEEEDWAEDEDLNEDEDWEGGDEPAVTPVPKLGGYWGKVAAEQGAGETSDGTIDLAQENERLKEELEAVNKQIKSMKNSLAAAHKQTESEREKYEQDLRELKLEHRELADLRELVFHSEKSAEERERREQPDRKYVYPYTTVKRTVVFGGHDSFLRVLRQMLPDVKYVDADNLTYSPEIIRNADVVWIQNNCISHSQYWSIVKNCKLAGVQMRYFGYAGAEKCAEQLVTEDLK